MRLLITLTFGIFFGLNLFAQESKINELVEQGIELHDQGKYDEAIAKYKAALDIDKNSTLANYELSYTCMHTQKYEEGIKYSEKVIKLNADNQHAAYVVLGSCLDLLGKPDKAIKTYEEGLKKFPVSNLLNYNLALTSYNQQDYDAAEKGAINAIVAKPTHGSSHAILAATMYAKEQRIKSVLSTYYFLMLEPNSYRSKINYDNLRNLLDQGVEKEDEKNISINVPLNSSKDDEFGAAEVMLSLLAASKHTEENSNKTDMDLFVETTHVFFSVLGELKNENTGFWWDFYVVKFDDLVQSDNYEAYCYYISQSLNLDDINSWISKNPEKMQRLKDWMNK